MSRGDLLLLVAVLAVFGVVDAAYLTWEWYAAPSASFCDLNSYWSCSEVRNSPFASIGGVVPTSVIGLGGFLLLLLVAVLGLRGGERLWRWTLDVWLLLLALAGAGVGVGLTLLEVFVIHAVCLLCLLGFLLDLGILAVAVMLWRNPEGRLAREDDTDVTT